MKLIQHQDRKQTSIADVGFMFIAYNLRRIMNIIGKDVFKTYLKQLTFLFSKIVDNIRRKYLKYKQGCFAGIYLMINYKTFLNRLIFDENIKLNRGYWTV